MFQGLGAFSFALLLAGCSSLPMNQGARSFCQNVDWYAIGRIDGANGKDANALDAHRQECGKTPFPPNAEMYENGREAGLVDFCTPRSGFEFGKDGNPYKGVCPLPFEAEFLSAYHAGLKEFQLQNENTKLETRMDSLYDKILSQSGPALTDKLRLRGELEQLKKQHTQNDAEINSLENSAVSL